jgi:hypothetical protein
MKIVVECVNGHEISYAKLFNSDDDLLLIIKPHCPECQEIENKSKKEDSTT